MGNTLEKMKLCAEVLTGVGNELTLADLTKLFRQELREEGLFNYFRSGLAKNKEVTPEVWFANQNPYNWVSGFAVWDETECGFEVWYDLNVRWRTYLHATKGEKYND